MAKVTAVQMAKAADISPKVFRSALHREKLRWHVHNHAWAVVPGSTEHEDMKRVLKEMLARR